MKKTIVLLMTTFSFALFANSLPAQEDVQDAQIKQERRERVEQRREQLTEQERAERRSQARERFESLSEEEQAQLRERRERRRDVRAGQRRSRGNVGVETSPELEL